METRRISRLIISCDPHKIILLSITTTRANSPRLKFIGPWLAGGVSQWRVNRLTLLTKMAQEARAVHANDSENHDTILKTCKAVRATRQNKWCTTTQYRQNSPYPSRIRNKINLTPFLDSVPLAAINNSGHQQCRAQAYRLIISTILMEVANALGGEFLDQEPHVVLRDIGNHLQADCKPLANCWLMGQAELTTIKREEEVNAYISRKMKMRQLMSRSEYPGI